MPRAKPKPLELPEDDGELVGKALRQILAETNLTTPQRLKAIELWTKWQMVMHKIKGKGDDEPGSFFGGG